MDTFPPCDSLLFPIVQVFLEQTLELVNRKAFSKYVILLPNVRPASILLQLQQLLLARYFDLFVMALIANCGEAREGEGSNYYNGEKGQPEEKKRTSAKLCLIP